MEILSVSLNHVVTPLEVRERVAFQQDDGEAFLRLIKERGRVDEALLVSTCNRTEIYAAYEFDAEIERGPLILDLLAETRDFEPTESPRNYAMARNEGAVRHLFRVASGLESQLLGESQILGQVKHALEWARAAETSGRLLHRLWERALRVGKRVRSETAIGEGALSASYAALQLARKIFGELEDRQLLIVGTGEIGVLALENLEGQKIGGLTIMNRTRSHAERLAERFGGNVRDLVELPDGLVDADIVISSTASPEPLISYDDMKQIRARRGGNRPLLIIDLAMPRDFDSRCGTLDEVFLKNLDDLGDIVRQNIAERRKEMPQAEAIIERELASFVEWTQSLEVEPTIRKLRELFHRIRKEEVELARASLDEESFLALDRMTRRLVNRLLHLPSANLRRHLGLRDQKIAAMVHELLTTQVPHPNALASEFDDDTDPDEI